MSAALQLPQIWASEKLQQEPSSTLDQTASVRHDSGGDTSLAFYRKHTEKTLQRYLYASMLVGRAPAMLGEPISRGWASSRPVRTFEDAVIFVLDVERCISRLDKLDRDLLSRIALQEYTYAEAAELLACSVRAVFYRYPLALDRLTALLLKAGLLFLPKH
ncbi:sigma factor-like helix-turn-helix DNA-binding protein [Occallatibacter savannae]|uniref:sigma-70 region 4 domain-containing protein n=1 Tax=Occallatibacter savannae TaxID=1002691 RepID=UPI000D69B1E2|nr:sigma-70 region 4 domain-containing protein [Occallatibacter savannae]